MRQADGGCIVRFAAVFSLLAFSTLAHAAVDGTVTNNTSGKPQEGATVTLFQPTNEGPQFIDSVKTDAAGRFTITKEFTAGPGPLLLQATYDGVQYNKMLPPGTPTTGVDIPVYESSRQPGGARIVLHAMLIEPNNGTMMVAESYQFQNPGPTAWNNPDTGTLQFALPAAAQGKVEVNVLAPGGLPIRRPADPAGKPNTFKVSFPIKPGTSEIRLEWSMPFTSPGVFENENLAKGAPSMKIVAPAGVTLTGDGVTALGPEPQMPGTMIYDVANAAYRINVEGTGSLSTGGGGEGQDDGTPRVSQNMPKLYGLAIAKGELLSTVLAVKWVLLSVLGMLAIGFAMLYRKSNPTAPAAAAGAKHERDRG
jgi:hypothetical protein